MKNDEHAFRFAGEVDNFRLADNQDDGVGKRNAVDLELECSRVCK